MTKQEAEEELRKMLEEGQQGPYYSAEEVFDHIHEMLAPKNIVYMTADTHGKFDRIVDFCYSHKVEAENTFIILGDAGLNYYGDRRDLYGKEILSRLPCTFFCLHGNHEMRPSEAIGYKQSSYHGGAVWVQEEYPNMLFAVDGEVYDFNHHSCLVIGGAYSVDKYYRQSRGWNWFSDEQPSQEIKDKVESVLSRRNWNIDIVLSHTCPKKYEPTEAFLPMVDQSTVDKSTEEWLDSIESKLSYERWYCGHYHVSKQIEKLRFLYQDYTLIPHTLSIADERAIAERMRHQAEVLGTLGLSADSVDQSEE